MQYEAVDAWLWLMSQANEDTQMFLERNAPIIDAAEITETDNVVPADSSERKHHCCHNWAQRQMVREMRLEFQNKSAVSYKDSILHMSVQPTSLIIRSCVCDITAVPLTSNLPVTSLTLLYLKLERQQGAQGLCTPRICQETIIIWTVSALGEMSRICNSVRNDLWSEELRVVHFWDGGRMQGVNTEVFITILPLSYFQF